MLANILPQEAFAFLLVMTRLIALVQYMPALGEQSIPRNVRVFLALLLTVAIYPAVSGLMPAIPGTVVGLIYLFVYEFLIGFTLALAARILMGAVHTAGTIISFQTGLAAAQSFDPSQGTQSAVVSSLLNLIAVTMIFVTELHHLMIMGFAGSYSKFPVGAPIPVVDFASLVTHFVIVSFRLGMQIAAPFILYAFMFNLSMGLIARLIPQFQVFFVGLPVNIFLGFGLLATILGSLMVLFMGHLRELLMSLIG